jgi:hypothetical protein
MSVSLHKALAAETHPAEGLTLKLWLTTKVVKSPILLEGIRKLTISNMKEQLILFLNSLMIVIIITIIMFQSSHCVSALGYRKAGTMHI